MPVRPRAFIGCSTEGLEVAAAVQRGLKESLDSELWSSSEVFVPSLTIIENLERALEQCPLAVIVMTPDDVLESRGARRAVPRYNLLIELGLFMGRHGRRSVFVVAPEELTLPSDLGGVTLCRYRRDPGTGGIDVAPACRAIRRGVRSLRAAAAPALRPPSPFWELLSNVVVIVYGVERSAEPGEHPKVSLRDLDAAQRIASFLARGFPTKSVLTFPVSAQGWQHALQQPNADLLLIGGFVANPEAARHAPERSAFRLKQSRVCRIAGQRVYHIDFAPPRGVAVPPRDQPLAIGRFPSEYVTRDFAHVVSARRHLHGAWRRVVAIGGIKGNGTRGAAMCLTSADQLDGLWKAPLEETTRLELVIAVEVAQDFVVYTRVVEAARDGRLLAPLGEAPWEPCELGLACAGCRFGE